MRLATVIDHGGEGIGGGGGLEKNTWYYHYQGRSLHGANNYQHANAKAFHKEAERTNWT